MKVIYIAGTGHCGSTLLDLLMGSSPEVFSTGEISFYNIYRDGEMYNKNNSAYRCTCGKDFDACDFWNKVNASGNFKIKKRYTLIENIKVSLRILFPFLNRNKTAFTDDSYELFEAVKQEAAKVGEEPVYLLDSSKDPRRLFYLLNDERIDVHVVYLMRDARAVGHSYNAKSRLKFNLTRKNFYTSIILRWLAVNTLVGSLLKRMEVQKNAPLVLDYEHFCRQTPEVVSLLNKRFGIYISETDYIAKLNKTTYHNVDGNELRFKKIDNIKLSERWRGELTQPQRKFAKMISTFFGWMINVDDKTKMITADKKQFQ